MAWEAPEYVKWLEQEGAEANDASRAIFQHVHKLAEVFHSSFWDACIPQQSNCPAGHFKLQMKNWRSSTHNRDALQTAVKHRCLPLVIRLAEGQMYNVETYRGLTGYLNHPAHMALCIGNVDMLRALLPLLPSTQVDDWTVTALTDEGCPVYSSSYYYLQCHWSLLVLLYYHYYRVFASQDPRQLTKSCIEFVWDLLRKLCRDMTWNRLKGILLTLRRGNCCFDAAIPFYQLVNVVQWDDDLIEGDFGIQELLILPDDQIRFMLSYMRKDQLPVVRKAAVKCLAPNPLPRSQRMYMGTCNSRKIGVMLQAELEERQVRSLQRMCMFTILQSVGGVAVNLMPLSIPSRLKALFQIPLQDKYEELCEAHQQNEDDEVSDETQWMVEELTDEMQWMDEEMLDDDF